MFVVCFFGRGPPISKTDKSPESPSTGETGFAFTFYMLDSVQITFGEKGGLLLKKQMFGSQSPALILHRKARLRGLRRLPKATQRVTPELGPTLAAAQWYTSKTGLREESCLPKRERLGARLTAGWDT